MSSNAICSRYSSIIKGKNTPDVGYESLANAIIVQALIDYDLAVKRILNNEFTNDYQYDKEHCEHYIKDVPSFLNSQYFNLLTDLDGEYLLNEMKHCICNTYGVKKDELPV